MRDLNFLIGNGIDANTSLELLGDIRTYNEALTDFLYSIKEKLMKIQNYRNKNDMKNYSIFVHSLKSDSKYLGFTTLSKMAYQHEIASKDNDINYIQNNYNQLIIEAIRVAKVVQEYLNIKADKQQKNEKGNSTDISSPSLLIVDDSKVIQNLIKKVCGNVPTVLASDGEEAINIIKSNPGTIKAIMLDLNMPNVGGFEVLNYLNNNKLLLKIPVVIITGDDSKETIQKAFSYPIKDVLNKPFSERNIESIVNKLINL